MTGLKLKLKVKNQLIVKYSSKNSIIPTSHNIGKKEVFVTKDQCEAPLMQAAKGFLLKAEEIPFHFHPTMEEFFYILHGEINFVVNGKSYLLTKGDFIKIPAKSLHSLVCQIEAEFIYYGIQIN